MIKRRLEDETSAGKPDAIFLAPLQVPTALHTL